MLSPTAQPITLLALYGSLRTQSRCAALLRATRALAPAGMDVHLFHEHGALPLFNPDHENESPRPVQDLRERVTSADAILIVTPEYAHGVSGVMKNTLDWLVGHPPFSGKPVAVFNPAMGSHHADAALKEILRTMSADLIPDACVRIPVIGSGVAAEEIAGSPEFGPVIRTALAAIIGQVQFAKAHSLDP